MENLTPVNFVFTKWKGFNDLHYFERVEDTSGRNLKMCLFPRKGKKIKLFSLFLHIFTSIFTKWKIFPHGVISTKRNEIQ